VEKEGPNRSFLRLGKEGEGERNARNRPVRGDAFPVFVLGLKRSPSSVRGGGKKGVDYDAAEKREVMRIVESAIRRPQEREDLPSIRTNLAEEKKKSRRIRESNRKEWGGRKRYRADVGLYVERGRR